MTISSAAASGLMATRMQSDLEFKLQAVSQRRLALLDKSKDAYQQYSNATMTPGTEDDAYYEEQLVLLQVIDKELDTQMRNMETQLKIITEEKEQHLKLAKQNAKKEFSISA